MTTSGLLSRSQFLPLMKQKENSSWSIRLKINIYMLAWGSLANCTLRGRASAFCCDNEPISAWSLGQEQVITMTVGEEESVIDEYCTGVKSIESAGKCCTVLDCELHLHNPARAVEKTKAEQKAWRKGILQRSHSCKSPGTLPVRSPMLMVSWWQLSL